MTDPHKQSDWQPGSVCPSAAYGGSLYEPCDNRNAEPRPVVRVGKFLKCPADNCKGVINARMPDRCPECGQRLMK